MRFFLCGFSSAFHLVKLAFVIANTFSHTTDWYSCSMNTSCYSTHSAYIILVRPRSRGQGIQPERSRGAHKFKKIPPHVDFGSQPEKFQRFRFCHGRKLAVSNLSRRNIQLSHPIKVAVKGSALDFDSKFSYSSNTGLKTIVNGFASFVSRNKDSMPVDNIKDKVDATDRISHRLQGFSVAVLGSWNILGI